MKTRAAVLVATGQPLELAELVLPDPGPGQVLVEVVYSGVCHTQVLECRGHRGKDRFLPHCLGHEAGGIVRGRGPGVSKVKPGDRAILSWIKGTGADVFGWCYDWSGRKVNAGPITTFGRHTIVSENRLTVIPAGTPLDQAAMLGCAVPTGLGAVFNTARPAPGQSLVVFGTGGIGLCAVAGASIAGCTPIIAVDLNPAKLELARRMGATHTLDAAREDLVAELKRLCPGGVDFAIEATGRPDAMSKALASVRMQGGAAVVIGNARQGERLDLDPRELNMGKQLRGTWGGDNLPDRDFPRYLNLLQSGRLDLGPLITRTYTLDQINDAIDDLEAGKVARPLIRMSDSPE
jgi:S-(hydroxymethyl)glutathione dehydrogenase/alcohol dehydrogenase